MAITSDSRRWVISRDLLSLHSIFILYIVVAASIFFSATYPAIVSFLQVEESSGSAVIGIWDAFTYHSLAMNMDSEEKVLSVFALANHTLNLAPPVILLTLLNNNPIYVFLFNIIILYSSLFVYLKCCPSDVAKKILFLVLLNPFVLATTLSINKEITSIAALLFMVSFVSSGIRKYLLLSLILAFFSRLELIIVLVSFVLLRKFSSKRNRYFAICAYLVFMAALIPYINTGRDTYEKIQGENSLNITNTLNTLASEYYLYTITFFPKAALNLFGEPLLCNVQNYAFYSGCMFFLLTISILKSRKFVIQNNIAFLILLYLILFSAFAIVHHRYFLPLYPLFVILYAEKKYGYLSLRIQKRSATLTNHVGYAGAQNPIQVLPAAPASRARDPRLAADGGSVTSIVSG